MREARYSQDVLQVLTDMVKAKLLQVQFPASNEPSLGRLAETQCSVWLFGKHAAEQQVNRQKHILTRDGKEANGQPKSVYSVTALRNWGLPKGREPYGNGVPISSRKTGKPSTGRRGTGRSNLQEKS